jgi:crossover junction endodeoxyribonuclease RusA
MKPLFEKHETHTVNIRLPLPPSVNEYQPHAIVHGRVIRYFSEAGKKFKNDCLAAVLSHFNGWPPDPFTGPVKLLAVLHGRNRQPYDIDNRIKPLLDALTECRVWLDDSQVNQLVVSRGPVSAGGRVDVTIEPIPE